MTDNSYAREIEKIQSASTIDEIQAIVRQFDAKSTADGGVLYSRQVGDVSSELIAKELSARTEFPIINDTLRAQFLSNDAVREAIEKRSAILFKSFGELPDQALKSANSFLYGDDKALSGPTSLRGSLWGEASHEFASSLSGDIKLVASAANTKRIFGAVELPAVANNPDVTSVAGMPRAELAVKLQQQGPDGVIAELQDQFIRATPKGLFVLPENEGERPTRVIASREFGEAMDIDSRRLSTASELHFAGLPVASTGFGQIRPEWEAARVAYLSEPTTPAHARTHGIGAGFAIEAAITAYEWNDTRQRAQVFQHTLHNDTAALDAYVRQGAQTAGMVAGTIAAGATATALNVGSGGTAALVVGEAYLFGKAAEHGVELWQKHRVYNVTSEGVNWEFNGRQWIREDLRADLVDDGRNVSQQQDFAAAPDKARELSAKASVIAVEQALAAVPTPREPFVQMAGDGSGPWTYQPDGGVWTREVVTAYDVNGIASAKDTVEAKGERSAQLSAQAIQVIDGNLKAGPAEIAAQYEKGHKTYGYEQTPGGAMSGAATTALNPDVLQASDGKHYRRDAQGAWTHEGDAATARFALELELTRARLLPALQDHQQQLARIPDLQPPTPEEKDRAILRQAYIDKGVDPTVKPGQLEASYQAVQRTREAAGVSAANTSLVLGPNANGTFTLESPIHHLREYADGKVRIAAITTPGDMTLARTDMTTAPHAIERTSEQGRDVREQATREANRHGLSQDDVQQVAQAAVAGVTMRTPSSGGSSAGNAARTAGGDADEAPQDRREPAQVAPAASPLPPDFAPSQQGLRDLRDPQHEGHHALGEMQYRARLFENQQHIPHGAHTERLGAEMLAFAVENRFHYSNVRLAKDQDTGQVQLEHARYGHATQRFPADLAAMSSQPIEATSQRINEAVSRHNGQPSPALERTHEQAQVLSGYAFGDKVLFGVIRSSTPGHISDDHVALATRMAKENSIDANNIARVSMVGDQIRTVRSGPDEKTVLVDVSKPAPPLQDSVSAVNTLNQQQAHVLAQQQDQPTQDGPDRGPKGPKL